MTFFGQFFDFLIYFWENLKKGNYDEIKNRKFKGQITIEKQTFQG